jgi:hypothetical protein
METLINFGIILTYVMVAIATIIAIVFGIIQMMQNKKNAKKILYSMLGLIAVILLSYIMASDEVLGAYEKYEITASTSKQVGMGLNTFYILAIIAVIAVLYAELSKVLSK